MSENDYDVWQEFSCDGIGDPNATPDVVNILMDGCFRDNIWQLFSDPRFSFYAYYPESIYKQPMPKFRILSMIHGSSRDISWYTNRGNQNSPASFQALADKYDLIFVVPIFPVGPTDSRHIVNYHALRDSGIDYDEVLISMIAQIKQRVPTLDTKNILLGGHSGGGQYTMRFLYCHPELLMAASIGAPGDPTLLDGSLDYPWGIRDFEERYGRAIDFSELRKPVVQLLIGDKDSQQLLKSPTGSTRRERMDNLYRSLSEHGVYCRYDILENYGHSSSFNPEQRCGKIIEFFTEVLEGRFTEDRKKSNNQV